MDDLKELAKPVKKGYIRPIYNISEYFESRKKGTGILKVRS